MYEGKAGNKEKSEIKKSQGKRKARDKEKSGVKKPEIEKET